MKPVTRPAPVETAAPSASDGDEAAKPKRRRTVRRVVGDDAPTDSTDKTAAE
jgi:hypothetical protein